MDIDQAIRTRRTIKRFDGSPVDRATLIQLIELAIWAPNHRRTEPWRFTVAEQPRLADLAATACARLTPRDGVVDASFEAKQNKLRELLAGAGAIVAVAYVRSPDDAERDREDYAATACAIQNLLLGATGRGLASYWTTSKSLIGKTMYPFWQVADGEDLVGAVVLGGAALAMPALRHMTVAEVTRWL